MFLSPNTDDSAASTAWSLKTAATWRPLGPRGPNGRHVAAVFKDQAVLAALSSVFGLKNIMSTGMGVLLSEAFASSRLPGALAGAEHLKWAVREGLINAL